MPEDTPLMQKCERVDGSFWTQRARGHGWTVQQFAEAIKDLPPMSQTAIGKHLGLSQGIVSQLMTRAKLQGVIK